MLPSSANVEAVLSRLRRDRRQFSTSALCLDMSTIDPGTSQRVAARLEERDLRFL